MTINFNKVCMLASLVLVMLFVACAGGQKKTEPMKDLPRVETPEALTTAMDNFLTEAAAKELDIHSVMVVQHGNVLYQHWQSEGKEDVAHVLNSVSKTFTSTAVGLAIADGKLKLTDQVISFFQDKLPAEVSDNLSEMTVRDLLTMNCGHDTDPTGANRGEGTDWAAAFLAYPVEHKPGTYYCYNSLGTYMLSAIVQQVTGEKVLDYLTPRLFEPLNIDKPEWSESPQGINCGGWGLYLKTEDLAKMGQLLLNKGEWNGHQLIPAEWVAEMSKAQVPSVPASVHPEQAAELGLTKENSDWMQGYGYQMWRCRNNAFRADGANGQYIIVMPDQDAVVAITAHLGDMQAEINLVWDHILPALK